MTFDIGRPCMGEIEVKMEVVKQKIDPVGQRLVLAHGCLRKKMFGIRHVIKSSHHLWPWTSLKGNSMSWIEVMKHTIAPVGQTVGPGTWVPMTKNVWHKTLNQGYPLPLTLNVLEGNSTSWIEVMKHKIVRVGQTVGPSTWVPMTKNVRHKSISPRVEVPLTLNDFKGQIGVIEPQNPLYVLTALR